MLGDNLRVFREKAKVSKSELARAINVTPAMISKYETGLSNPSAENLRLMANYFDISMDTLCDNKCLFAPGGSLRELRLKKKISRVQAANVLGVVPAVYAELENGVRQLCDEQITTLLNLFGASQEQLDNVVPTIYELQVIRLEQRLQEAWNKLTFEQQKRLVEFLGAMGEC